MKKIIILILACFMVLAGCSKAETAEEETVRTDSIFDTSYVHEINVEISEEDWNDLKANPLEKTKYHVNVTIDGETVNDVSFATKGNTSLSSVASDSESDRYSFKLNFGKFVDGQTFQSLKKLNLNNIYADATYMKDYLSYQLFQEAGALSSRCSYVWLTINGEDFGLYTAIEEVDQAFLDVNTESAGALYKPEAEELDNAGQPGERPEGEGMMPHGFNDGERPEMPEGMTPPEMNGQERPEGFDPAQGQPGQMPGGPGNMNPPDMNGQQMPPGFDPSQNQQIPEMPEGQENITPPDTSGIEIPEMPEGIDPSEIPQMPEGFDPSQGQGGMPGGGGMFSSGNGSSLVYTDDELSSYTDIFDNAETDVTEDDEMRVIAALKNLAEGDVKASVDVENTVKYFAVHNFVMNYDSYTGNMLHNYYLYEKDSLLTMIPWDYNLAYGAFVMGGRQDASSIINWGIDSPLSNTDESQRPMWSWIMSDQSYTDQYHAVLDQLLSDYFESGEFEKEFDRVVEMIRPYVEKDPSAFYTADEFDAAGAMLKQFCLLRAESVRKQLDGSLSAISSEQNAADRVDASAINIDVMGTHSGGKERPDQPRQ